MHNFIKQLTIDTTRMKQADKIEVSAAAAREYLDWLNREWARVKAVEDDNTKLRNKAEAQENEILVLKSQKWRAESTVSELALQLAEKPASE